MHIIRVHSDPTATTPPSKPPEKPPAAEVAEPGAAAAAGFAELGGLGTRIG